MYVLECSCGNREFAYDDETGFECLSCGEVYTEEEAGKNLIGVEEEE